MDRLPWVSIAVALACGAAFAAARLGFDETEYVERREAAVRFWAERPYLELPPPLSARFGLAEEDRAHVPRALVHPAPADATVERAALARLTALLVEAHDALPVRRFGLVPARGALQPGWLTSIFVHADAGHLLVNLLVLLLVGPPLERAWGRLRYLALFLAGGVLAGAAQALPMGRAETAIVGASGAVSACLGAFALWFGARRVLRVPAWALALVALGLSLAGLWSGDEGIAYGAHLGGFGFGLGAAALVRASERRP